jgi:hypothetical protein
LRQASFLSKGQETILIIRMVRIVERYGKRIAKACSPLQ